MNHKISSQKFGSVALCCSADGTVIATGDLLSPLFPVPVLNRNKFEPKTIIFNPPATIVFWKDGTKTVAKCGADEEFSEEFGFLACLSKKIYGSRSAFKSQFKNAHRPYLDDIKNDKQKKEDKPAEESCCDCVSKQSNESIEAIDLNLLSDKIAQVIHNAFPNAPSCKIAIEIDDE